MAGGGRGHQAGIMTHSSECGNVWDWNYRGAGCGYQAPQGAT